MRRINILWIDDDPERNINAKSMDDYLDLRVAFLDLKEKDLKAALEIIHGKLTGKKPDLILLDHRLDKLDSDHILTGSSVAEFIRDILPACPIVAVTAVDRHDIDFKKRSNYEDIFSITDISDKYETLISIVNGYRRLNKESPQSAENLLTLLKVPKDEQERIFAVLPDDLRVNFSDESLHNRISRWVRHVLMGNPGFLYDSLWTATLLGIKVKSFKKIKDVFKKAEYKGIFFGLNNPRWWPTQVKKILYKSLPQPEYQTPESLGHHLEGLTRKDISVCYACKDPFPETVAFLDDSQNEQKPMHLRCTISNPKSQKMLFFEEVRVMKGAD